VKRFYQSVALAPFSRHSRESGNPASSFAVGGKLDSRFRGNDRGDGFEIRLDDRPIKTPARNALVLPTNALAQAVAAEWEEQGDKVDPRSMPLTGLANAAIDRVAPDPACFAQDLARYGESDLLCYRAEEPPELVARQADAWDPLLAWARGRYDIAFEIVTGIMHRPQPPATVARLAEAMAGRDPFTLAAFSPLVTISGSLLIVLALAEGAIAPDAAFDAAHLDELYQAERWGEDTLATEARDARRRDFKAAARFLTLL
jgi:chaperone required for assembly of F1-ATPase